MRNILFLIFIGVCFMQPAGAQVSNDKIFNSLKMDSLLEAISGKNKAMVSIAISKNGQTVYSRAVGSSTINGDIKTPATIQSRYRIGSITKIFTGVMIFQLIEEGKLKLSTPLSAYYPALPNASKITIGHMLEHSSGLFNFTNDTTYSSRLNKKVSQTELLASFKVPVVFEPGVKHEYSNTNFVLLGFIIEKLDKKTYAAALKSRILDKAVLKDTYYGGKINPLAKEANSYKWAVDHWQAATETDMSIPAGAGALVSTATDLTKFMEALFSHKLITEASLNEMKTMKDGYGKALFSFPFYERKAYGHNGGIDGFQSQASYYPEDKVSFAYLCNGVNMNLNDMAIGVLSIYFNKPYQVPDFNAFVVRDEDLDKYLGGYASTQIPLKLTFTKKNGVLMGQATGQSAFPLDATKENEFKFNAAGIVLTFDPANKQVTLKQGGGTYLFSIE